MTDSTITLTGVIESGQVLAEELDVYAGNTWTRTDVDVDGTFSLVVPLAFGKNHLLFRTWGLVPSTVSGEKWIVIRNNMRSKRFTIEYVDPLSIRGVIFDACDPAYKPLANAVVRLRLDPFGSVVEGTTTNSEGEYAFYDLPDNTTYTVWATRPGYSANMVSVKTGGSSALYAGIGLDQEYTTTDMLGRWYFDVYMGVSPSSAFFDLEAGGAGDVNNHADTPLTWQISSYGEFTMTWWSDVTRTTPTMSFQGIVSRDPSWPEENPIEEGDPVYVYGLMVDEVYAPLTPKIFKASR